MSNRLDHEMRTDDEIEDQRNEASLWAAEGRTAVSGMSYEEGVRDALEWAMGDSDDLPIQDKVDDIN